MGDFHAQQKIVTRFLYLNPIYNEMRTIEPVSMNPKSFEFLYIILIRLEERNSTVNSYK
jgi:hypothetical protein